MNTETRTVKSSHATGAYGCNEILSCSLQEIDNKGLRLATLYGNELYQHCERVARLCIQIGQCYNFNLNELIHLGIGAYLHDIGKCEITGRIMDKPGRLSRTEYQLVQSHPSIGFRRLQEYGFSEDIMNMVLYHHERLDGSGYPTGKSDIDIFTQILTVADIYDAAGNKRVYHEGRSEEEVFDILAQTEGINQVAVRILKQLVKEGETTYE